MAELVLDNLTREECVYMAKLAQEMGRYKDMVKIMKKLVDGLRPPDDLTADEMRLLEAAYDNALRTLRTSRRKLSPIWLTKKTCWNEVHFGTVLYFRSNIEIEITELCDGIHKLLKENLLPLASSNEAKVFYMRKKGEFYGYLAELSSGAVFENLKTEAMNAYDAAQDIARVSLPASHPARLKLLLSLAAFYEDVLNAHDDAIDILQQAVKNAFLHIHDEVKVLGEMVESMRSMKQTPIMRWDAQQSKLVLDKAKAELDDLDGEALEKIRAIMKDHFQ